MGCRSEVRSPVRYLETTSGKASENSVGMDTLLPLSPTFARGIVDVLIPIRAAGQSASPYSRNHFSMVATSESP